MGLRTRTIQISLLASVLLISCTGTRRGGEALLDGVPVNTNQLNADWVRAATTSTRRGNTLVFRGPVLRLNEVVAGPGGAAGGAGVVESARSGYLLAEQQMATGALKHFAVFEWDMVDQGYARVGLADGRPLRFRTGSTATSEPCVSDCLPVVRTVIAEVPEDALRLVPPVGLRLLITLDSGASFDVTAPQAYVRGYLQAVDNRR